MPPALPATTAAPAQHAVFAETAHFFQKQRSAIDKLRADNAALKEELRLENRFSVQPTAANAAALIQNLKKQSDVYTKKIGEEKVVVADLKDQYKNLKSDVAQQQKDMGGTTAAQQENIQTRKSIYQLEGRVQQASIRCNEAQTRTRALKRRTDDLRRERLVFNDLLRKLGASCDAARASALQSLKHTHHANLARDRAGGELAELTATSDRDQAANEAEWDTLTQLIEADRRQQEAERAKELQEQEARTQAILHADAVAPKAKPGLSLTVVAQDAGQQRIAQLTAAFQAVKEATGSDSVEQILAQFQAGKDANFSLLSYVSDVHAEVDKLEAQIATLTAEVHKYKGTGTAAADTRRAGLQDLEGRLQTAQHNAYLAETKAQAASDALATVRQRAGELCDAAGCAPSLQGLLGTGGVTDKNLMQYLGILEQRAYEIIQEYIAASAQDEATGATRMATLLGSEMSTLSLTSASSASLTTFTIEPPSSVANSHWDAEEMADLDVDGHPADRQVLTAKVERALQKHADALIHLRGAMHGAGPSLPSPLGNASNTIPAASHMRTPSAVRAT